MKTITFNFDGTDYTLEYTKRTIRQMENGGFNISEATSKVVSGMEALFAGSFLAHHPRINDSTINAIWKALPDKQEFVSALVDLYNNPINEMFDEPEKNAIKWTLNG